MMRKGERRRTVRRRRQYELVDARAWRIRRSRIRWVTAPLSFYRQRRGRSRHSRALHASPTLSTSLSIAVQEPKSRLLLQRDSCGCKYEATGDGERTRRRRCVSYQETARAVCPASVSFWAPSPRRSIEYFTGNMVPGAAPHRPSNRVARGSTQKQAPDTRARWLPQSMLIKGTPRRGAIAPKSRHPTTPRLIDRPQKVAKHGGCLHHNKGNQTNKRRK